MNASFSIHTLSCFLSVVLVASASRTVDAQDRQPGQKTAPRQQAQQPTQQSATKIDPALVRALTEWHKSSQAIEKLEGRHKRFTYDYVFNVEKQASGEFFYQAPDKGRIDLTPVNVKTKEQKKKHPTNGKVHTFKVQSDVPERWICDGKRILVIDDSQKTVQQFNIPKEAQGANIMDGPLPFLFGMPPQKAIARWRMKLLVANQNLYEIFVQPKRAPDTNNYKWARVQIERKTMLPVAVQMMDPTGKRETVYTFPEIKKNPRKPLIPWVATDPFNPKLKGYVVQAPVPEVKKGGPNGTVPSVVGLSFRNAELTMKRAGYQVVFVKGEPAINDQLVHHVAAQEPKGKMPLKAGSKVRLTLFTKVGTTNANKAPTVPNLAGLYYKDAEANLKKLGYTAKFHKGRIALQTKDVFRVYEQTPPAGALLEPGQAVHMTVFIRPTQASSKTGGQRRQ